MLSAYTATMATIDDKHTQVADQYQIAGHPRTIHTLQHYYNSGRLDYIKFRAFYNFITSTFWTGASPHIRMAPAS